MANVLAQSKNVTSLIGICWEQITGNELLATIALCGLIAAAIGVIMSLKSGAHL